MWQLLEHWRQARQTRRAAARARQAEKDALVLASGSEQRLPRLLQVLPEIDMDKIADILIPYWSRFSPFVCEQLVKSLTDCGFIAYYRRQLSHPDEERRAAAVRVLGEIDPEGFLNQLIAALGDQAHQPAFTAVEILAKVSPPGLVERLLDEVEAGRILPARAAQVLCGKGKGVVSELLTALSCSSDKLQGFIVEVLGEIGSPQALSAVGKVLASDQDELRLKAIQSLAGFYHPGLLPYLETAAGDELWTVRLHATKVLGRQGNPKGLPVLERLLADEEELVRYGAAEALARMGAEGLAVLRQVSGDNRHPGCREAALFLERKAEENLAE